MNVVGNFLFITTIIKLSPFYQDLYITATMIETVGIVKAVFTIATVGIFSVGVSHAVSKGKAITLTDGEGKMPIIPPKPSINDEDFIEKTMTVTLDEYEYQDQYEFQDVTLTLSERYTNRDCKCAPIWYHNKIVCDSFCCNPDNDPKGEWCAVEDPERCKRLHGAKEVFLFFPFFSTDDQQK